LEKITAILEEAKVNPSSDRMHFEIPKEYSHSLYSPAPPSQESTDKQKQFYRSALLFRKIVANYGTGYREGKISKAVKQAEDWVYHHTSMCFDSEAIIRRARTALGIQKLMRRAEEQGHNFSVLSHYEAPFEYRQKHHGGLGHVHAPILFISGIQEADLAEIVCFAISEQKENHKECLSLFADYSGIFPAEFYQEAERRKKEETKRR
jgi:hypothetical protein